jgi:hypothetical protein
MFKYIIYIYIYMPRRDHTSNKRDQGSPSSPNNSRSTRERFSARDDPLYQHPYSSDSDELYRRLRSADTGITQPDGSGRTPTATPRAFTQPDPPGRAPTPSASTQLGFTSSFPDFYPRSLVQDILKLEEDIKRTESYLNESIEKNTMKLNKLKKDINELKSREQPRSPMGKQRSQAGKPPKNSVGRRPLLKVLFFDLDDTILTSVNPMLNVTSLRTNFIKLGSTYKDDSVSDEYQTVLDTITTTEIVELLKYCTMKDDIKWFIISQEENKDKLDQLFNNYVSEINPDNYNYGVNMFNHKNKKRSIEKLLKRLDESFYIPKSIFVDDNTEHTRLVSEIKGVSVINVSESELDDRPMTLMTKENCDECMKYLSDSRTARKRTQKKRK